MSRENDEQFGNTIVDSRWFNGKPQLDRKVLQPVQVRWLCPYTDCGGEMIYNGSTWPMNPPGYHHTCNVCGFTAAVKDCYPKIEYQDVPPTCVK